MEIYEPDFERVNLIGIGAFGKVYKCKNKVTNAIFAVKVIEKSGKNFKSIVSEIKVLGSIPVHNRLVTFHGVKNDGDTISIFTEFLSQGSLKDYIKKNGYLSEDKAAKYIKMIVEGIDFLHSNKVIHRDIKCGNILLDVNDDIKLTDFGLSKIVDDESIRENHTCCGTSYFMAPEIIKKENYNASVDIWSLGVTSVEMLTGDPIYFHLKGGEFLREITTTKMVVYNLPKPPSNQLNYFLQLTFTINPNSRPCAKDLLRTQFLLTAIAL